MAELTDEQAAAAYRRLCAIYKRHPGIRCGCEFSDDNEDRVISWCSFHAEIRDQRDEAVSILASLFHMFSLHYDGCPEDDTCECDEAARFRALVDSIEPETRSIGG